MHHLHPGMDTCVCTGGTGNSHRMPAGRREDFLQDLLDGEAVDLALPARIGGAVILHGQENTLQNSTPFRKIPSRMIRASSRNTIPRAIQSFFVVFRTRRRVRPSPP